MTAILSWPQYVNFNSFRNASPLGTTYTPRQKWWQFFIFEYKSFLIGRIFSHLLQDQPLPCMMEPHRTLRISRTCCAEKLWNFWAGQAEIFIWIRSKTWAASWKDNQTIPTLSTMMWRIRTHWGTQDVEWHPSSINQPFNTQLLPQHS